MRIEDKRLKLLGLIPGDFVRRDELESLVGPVNGLAELNFSLPNRCGCVVQIGLRRRRVQNEDAWEVVR